MLIFIYLYVNRCDSQTLTQVVRGNILDADSRTALGMTGVRIFSDDTVLSAVSDADGRFRFDAVPLGRKRILFSLIGYKDVELQNVIVNSGKEVVLNVLMQEDVLVGKEVVIESKTDKTKANNELVTNSARSFQSEETERYAGSRGDPSRMAASYAGVATGNDARNDIIVRGNSPLGVLWRLEGSDIPNPNHFSAQGATGGPVSMLNNNILGSSDFLTGAFPSEYGNKMSAVFDLKFRNGNNEKMEFTGQFGLNGIEAGIEGPISKKNGSSYLINYRYSTLKLFEVLGISFGVSGIPLYQDLSFKIHLPTEKRGVFSFWGIGGASSISLLDSERDSTDWSFAGAGEDLVFGANMGATGASHTHYFGKNTFGKFSLSASASSISVLIDTLSLTKVPYRVLTNNSMDGQIFANYQITSKLNAKHLVKSGITVKNYLIDYSAEFWSRKYNTYMDELATKENAMAVQAFAHWQYRINDKLTLNNGLHYNMFALNNTWSIEPRSGLAWKLGKRHQLSGAFGMHSQSLPLIYYFFQQYDSLSASMVNTNRDLDMSKSLHYILGYEINLDKDLRIKLENYYQDVYNLHTEKYRSSSFSAVNIGSELNGITLVDSLENKGTGFNYGTELTIEKYFSKRYYFLSSLSLYESKYRGSDGILRHTAFSGGYVYNLLGGYELPIGKNKNHVLAFDAKFTFAGGNRYTPIDLPQSILKRQPIYIDSLAFTGRLKDYQKIDLKVSYRLNSKNATHYIFLHVENILNRKNILQQVYNTDRQEIVEEYQLGLFPYGGYRIEF